MIVSVSVTSRCDKWLPVSKFNMIGGHDGGVSFLASHISISSCTALCFKAHCYGVNLPAFVSLSAAFKQDASTRCSEILVVLEIEGRTILLRLPRPARYASDSFQSRMVLKPGSTLLSLNMQAHDLSNRKINLKWYKSTCTSSLV